MTTFTLAHLQALDEAVTSGELEIRRKDWSVTYRSMAELLQARKLIQDELRAAGLLGTNVPSATYATFSRD